MGKTVRQAVVTFTYRLDNSTIMESVGLIFDKATPSLNQFCGQKWGKLNWKKKYLCRMKNVQPLVRKPTKVRMRVYRYGLKLLDRDNLPGGLKPLLDALKFKGGKGIIWDDAPEYLDLVVFDNVVEKRNLCRTEVVIEYEEIHREVDSE